MCFVCFKAEISALEAKLAKLKEKESEFTAAIKQEENNIESVKMEFTPQQNALDKQQQEIEAREKSLQEEFVSKSNDACCVCETFEIESLELRYHKHFINIFTVDCQKCLVRFG